MRQTEPTLTAQILDRQHMDSAGQSGNKIERVTLRDGRELILKSVSPEWDFLSRATNDRGRIRSMWEGGVFDRIQAVVDHATVAVEPDDGAWNVFMSDVSDALVPNGRNLDRAEVNRLLAAVAELHALFWGENFPELCALEDRYMLLSPQMGRREKELGNPVGEMFLRGWDAFSELVPSEIAGPIFRILDEPVLLAEQLRGCAQTLIHGDVRLTNLGFRDDRVVLIDWGERTGTAPPAVELVSFLIFDSLRLDISREEVIAQFRSNCGERFEERALQLALIGGFVQLGPSFSLSIVDAPDEAARNESIHSLAWWTRTVGKALETWSPV